MTESGSGSKSKKKWYFAAAAAVAAVVTFLNGVFDLGDHVFGHGTDQAPAAAAGPSSSSTTPGEDAAPASSTSASPTPATKAKAGTTAAAPVSAQRSGPAWYDLTGYEAVSFGNGHSSVSSITIGNRAFPNSIKGYYPSSSASPNNRRTWLTAGTCDQLSVWVGKDAASSSTTGTGHFSVRAEDSEIAGADATITTQPQELTVDIAGVSRLTLLDTKANQDANNAWGSPKVHCTAPPGKQR